MIIGVFSFAFKTSGNYGKIPWWSGYSDVAGDYAGNDLYSLSGESEFSGVTHYPILLDIYISLMGSVGKDAIGSFNVNSLVLFFLALLSTFFLYKIMEEEKINKKRLLFFWILAPSMFYFMFYNWDFIPIFLILLSFYFFRGNKDSLAAFILGIGFAAKIYPVLFLLPMLLKRNLKKAVKMVLVFGATVLSINLIFMIISFDFWIEFYLHMAGRFSDLTSIWGVIHYYFPDKISVTFINLFSLLLFVALYLFVMWKQRKRSLIELSFLAILVYFAVNKVFSQQHTLWLLMFFVLTTIIRYREFITFEIINVIFSLASLYMFFIAPQNMVYLFIVHTTLVLREIFIVYFLIKVYKYKPERKLKM